MINTHILGEFRSGGAGRESRSWGLPSPKASWTALGAAVKRDDPPPLLGSGETYLDCCVQLQAPEDKKRCEFIGEGPARGHRDDEASSE